MKFEVKELVMEQHKGKFKGAAAGWLPELNGSALSSPFYT